MKAIKNEWYFPLIIGLHLIIWFVGLYLYKGNFTEVSSGTLLFGKLTNEPYLNIHRILGEVFSSWVVTVFAANFLMATRARWIEKIFGGLDKMYIIHRRSAIIAIFLLLAHFVIVPRDLTTFSPGKPLGFYALILILLGVILSAAPIFKKKIPYHTWVNFHKLNGLFYVMAVVHGIMVNSLIKELPLIRTYVFGMALIGVGAWFYKAFLYGIFNKKLDYVVSSVNNCGNGITEIYLNPVSEKLNYKAGQFAFFTFPVLSKREQHPFTISSHPSNNELRITIKALGDYTNKMPSLKEGDTAKVEGPFGLFHSGNKGYKGEVWIAGGIGITPFLPLSYDTKRNIVHLFWCVHKKEEAIYLDELSRNSNKNSNFEFIVWPSNKDGYLTVQNLKTFNFKDKEYYICGPKPLKESLTTQLKLKGVSSKQIHNEEFNFR